MNKIKSRRSLRTLALVVLVSGFSLFARAQGTNVVSANLPVAEK